MLALLGMLNVLVLLAVIMLNLLSPLVALIAVPVIAALLGGFGLATSKFILSGISGIAPVAGMFVFAILYFGIMTDAGMLDPIISRILRTVGRRPARISSHRGSDDRGRRIGHPLANNRYEREEKWLRIKLARRVDG